MSLYKWIKICWSWTQHKAHKEMCEHQRLILTYSRHSLSRHRFIRFFRYLDLFCAVPKFIPSYFYINFVFYLDFFHHELFHYLDLKFWTRFDIFALFSDFYVDVWKSACESKGVNNLWHVIKGVVIKSINSALLANPSCRIPDCLFHSAFNWQVSKLNDWLS